MNDKAGWEVEGFIDRLTRRDDTNSERLVLEAVSHLRAFSRDCDAMREDNREQREQLTEAAAFLDQIAERMDDRPFDIRDCAADCRAEARKLRGET